MAEDKRHLQLRLDPEIKKELDRLSVKYKSSLADIVRGALFFGLPVFDTLSELQNELIGRLLTNLKKNSRRKGD